MSFLATFKCDGVELNVLSFSYSLYQDVDATGRPSSVTRGGQFSITAEATGENKMFIWAIDSYKAKDGEIVFAKRDSGDSPLKTIKFKTGYLVNFQESFADSGGSPFMQSFTISAEEFSMDGATLKNKWPKNV